MARQTRAGLVTRDCAGEPEKAKGLSRVPLSAGGREPVHEAAESKPEGASGNDLKKEGSVRFYRHLINNPTRAERINSH